MKCYGRQPDSVNPTVRNENGGLLKRGLLNHLGFIEEEGMPSSSIVNLTKVLL